VSVELSHHVEQLCSICIVVDSHALGEQSDGLAAHALGDVDARLTAEVSGDVALVFSLLC
jgi:hypothetical protein